MRLLRGDDSSGFGGGAVGDVQAGRAGGAEGSDDATRCAAGAEDEDMFAGERVGVLVFEGVAQAASVGVVAAEFAVFLPQGVDGFSKTRISASLFAEAVGGFFVGQGDVERPRPPSAKKRATVAARSASSAARMRS